MRFAMHIQHETADRIRRIAAVIHQIVPVGVAALCYIAAKRLEKVETMLRGQISFEQYIPKRLRFGRSLALAEQRTPHLGEQRQLFGRRRFGMIGDIVRGARETVEGKNRRPKPFADQKGGDGKVLVRVALAGRKCGDVLHRCQAIACARPFHMPPRPRQC